MRLYCRCNEQGNYVVGNIGSFRIRDLMNNNIKYEYQYELKNMIFVDEFNENIYCIDYSTRLRKYDKDFNLISVLQLDTNHCYIGLVEIDDKKLMIYYKDIGEDIIVQIELNEQSIHNGLLNYKDNKMKLRYELFNNTCLYVMILMLRIKNDMEKELRKIVPKDVIYHIMSYL